MRSVFGEGFGSSPCALRVLPKATALEQGSAEYDETTIVELNAAGELIPGAKVQGWTAHVIRVR